MEVIATIMVIAVTIEGMVEYFSTVLQKGQIAWKQVAAIAAGILLALLAQVDLYAVVGVVFTVPYVGVVLTGIVLSRGANYASDFIKLITAEITAKTRV
jgi:hypothetical protein